MLQPLKENKPKKERKYKKEAQIDPEKEYQKVIEIKGDVFTFNMKGRQVLNQREFNRFVTRMDSYIRPFTASNFKKVPGGEFDELYNAFVYRLWRCIATFDNGDTSRVENRASFPTYFMSILRKDLENKRVTKDKSRTVARLRKKGKDFEANVVQGLAYATPLSTLEPWQAEQLGAIQLEEVINDDEDQYELVEVTTTVTTKTTCVFRKVDDEANASDEQETSPESVLSDTSEDAPTEASEKMIEDEVKDETVVVEDSESVAEPEVPVAVVEEEEEGNEE